MAGKNDMQWSSATPGLMVFLIDQSGSMLREYQDGESRTQFASKAINRVIHEIINKNFDGDHAKDRCYIAVIGYNHKVKKICSGFLNELYNNPIRVDKVKQKILDGAGGLLEIDKNMPIWVEPILDDGATNMYDAFDLAKQIVEAWIEKKPNNPAPVIINISDGIPYYNGKSVELCMSETVQLAEQIMNLKTEDGNVLIFNAEIGSQGKLLYPSSELEVSSHGEGAEFLYKITSVIPDGYMSAAKTSGLPVVEGSKACVFAADGVDLINLINFGSSKGTDK